MVTRNVLFIVKKGQAYIGQDNFLKGYSETPCSPEYSVDGEILLRHKLLLLGQFVQHPGEEYGVKPRPELQDQNNCKRE